jgi:hypothetical protein
MTLTDRLPLLLEIVKRRFKRECRWVHDRFRRESEAFVEDIFSSTPTLRLSLKIGCIKLVAIAFTTVLVTTGTALAQGEGGGGGGNVTTACDLPFIEWGVFLAISTVLTFMVVGAMIGAGIGGAKQSYSPSQTRREEGARMQMNAIKGVVSTVLIFVTIAVLVANAPFDIVTSCIPTF